MCEYVSKGLKQQRRLSGVFFCFLFCFFALQLSAAATCYDRFFFLLLPLRKKLRSFKRGRVLMVTHIGKHERKCEVFAAGLSTAKTFQA